MIPQLDGTHNISDSSNTDLHDYLDLASTNIIQYRTRGQKQRQKASKAEHANRHSANISIEVLKLCLPWLVVCSLMCECTEGCCEMCTECRVSIEVIDHT